jgi:hypothetical protein
MLAFLHTSNVHIAPFAQLVREFDDTVPIRHEVREDFLSAARAAEEVTDALGAEIVRAVQALANDGATLIVCTCSTIAAVAETTPIAGCSVLRIDRPMAEQAVASGRRLLVLAALRSTFLPTTTLLREVAADANRSPLVVEVLCEGAWPLFEAANLAGYIEKIAETIERVATPSDLVVLAQASMAPAIERVRHLGIPVLSSPRSGVEAAISRYRTVRARSPG